MQRNGTSAGMKIISDRPLARENLWSIRSVYE
jgi:hypothetical protein